jgi:hypothetical protein
MDSPGPREDKDLLTVSTTSSKGVVWIVVRGEVDLANREQLRTSLAAIELGLGLSIWTCAFSGSATALAVASCSVSRSKRQERATTPGSTGHALSCARSCLSSAIPPSAKTSPAGRPPEGCCMRSRGFDLIAPFSGVMSSPVPA